MMKSAYTMIDVAEAMAIVVSHAGRAAVRCEEVSVTPALLGRTLASDIIADCPFPPFRAAILDGFALDAGALPKSPPILLEVLDEAITAGTDPTVNVLGGSTCAYVTTGAKMPAGSTAVVGVEKTEEAARAKTINPLEEVAEDDGEEQQEQEDQEENPHQNLDFLKKPP